MTKQRKIPTPKELLAKADSVEGSFKLADYMEVMGKLREKGLSFRAIAKWLSEELGRPITHVQVFRILSPDTDPDDDSSEEQRERLSAELRAENELEAKQREDAENDE